MRLYRMLRGEESRQRAVEQRTAIRGALERDETHARPSLRTVGKLVSSSMPYSMLRRKTKGKEYPRGAGSKKRKYLHSKTRNHGDHGHPRTPAHASS